MVDNIAYDFDGLPVFTKLGSGDDNTANIQCSKTDLSKLNDSNVILNDKFNINYIRYDLTLTASTLVLDPIKSASKHGKIRKLSGLFRSNSSRSNLTNDNIDGETKTAVLLDGEEQESVDIVSIYGVKVLYKKFNSSQDCGEGRSYGFVVHFAEQKINKWKQRAIVVNHSDESTCKLWTEQIQQIIEGQSWRPRKMKVILQPHSGNKDTRFHYRSKIEVLLGAAGVVYDLLDLRTKREVTRDVADVDLKDYDCFLCVGGDGTVSKVINAVLNKSQQDMGQALKMGIVPYSPPITIGIVPYGQSNQIAMSLTGTDDPMTGALHAVLGHRSALDICSVYEKEQLIRWCFTAQYGFAANVLSLSERYDFLGQKKMEVAFMKALTKAKLKEYKCDIEYIVSPQSARSHPNDGVVCYSGCGVCSTFIEENRCMVEDLVEELNPLSISSTSSTIMDLTEESEWSSCKVDCLSVSLFTLPARSHFAPQGLSKYTHLTDGCVDVVMVKGTPRKQFLRHLKRHGTCKNQMDFPFIETRRVTEMRFRPRLPITWNYKDYDYNEIDYEMSRVHPQASRTSLGLVSLSSNEVTGETRDVADSETSDTESMTDKTPSPTSHSTHNPPPHTHAPLMPKVRLSFTEIEIKKRRERSRKKDEKRRSHDENKSRSLWCLDTEIVSHLELDFVVHQGLVHMCGLGVAEDTPSEQHAMRCLPYL